MGPRDYPGLTRLRRRAALVLRVEALLRAVAPGSFILLAYLVIALFGFGAPWLWLTCLTAGSIAIVVGIARLRQPAAPAIDRRIETASSLRHSPLAGLQDHPETLDPMSLLLWKRHQRQLAASLAAARTGPPTLDAARRDPYALRMLLALLLLTGLIVANIAAPSRLAGAFILPAWPFAGPRVDAWIVPPDYAAAPPHLLSPGEAVTALAGSRLSVIVNGLHGVVAISLAGTGFTVTNLGQTSRRADALLQHSGRLRIGPWWHRLAAWNLTIVPPAAPVISLRGLAVAPGAVLTLHWHIADQYGLAAFTADFTATGHPQALPQIFALPAAAGDGSATFDLSASPYHDLPVTFTLQAHNLAGRASGIAFGKNLVLPGLPLHDHTAMALDQLRQALALAPQNGAAIAPQLHALAAAPPSAITAAADLQINLLAGALTTRQLAAPAAVDRLLLLIKQIEAGPDYLPAQALAQAGQALMAELQRGLAGQQPGSATLQSLLQAVHQALARHLAALQQQGTDTPAGPGLDTAPLDPLAQQIAQDEAAGRTAQAIGELRQLQAALRALRALQAARPISAAQAAQAAAQQAAAQALSQLTNGEAKLLDDTHRGTATPGSQAQLQAGLATVHQKLQQVGQNLPGLSGAAKAMDAAGQALGQADPSQAEAAEGAAIQDLQQAAAALNQARQNSLAAGATSQMLPGQSGPDAGIDGAPDDSDRRDLSQPGANPAGVIEDRIMRQNADPSLPLPTHQYLQRLLQPDPSY